MVLGTVIYLVVFFLVTSDGLTYYNVGPLLLTGVLWNVLLLIVGVLVIIDGTRKLDAGKTQELLTGVFVVKLVAIPFFLINFALMVLLAFAGSLIFILGGMVLIAIAVNSIGLTSALHIDEPYSPALVDRLAERPRAGGSLLSPLAESWADRSLTLPPLAVENPMTTNGAGDASTAGLLYAMTRGASIERAVAIALACSAVVMSVKRPTASAVCALDASLLPVFPEQAWR